MPNSDHQMMPIPRFLRVNRAFPYVERVIDSKVYGSYAANPIRTIMLYANDNQGNTKSNTHNLLLCKLVVKVGNRFEPAFNPEIVEHNEEAKKALMQLVAS
ncbi:hypothetical protein [Runella sp.]|uniref:hypothetical protein n=1 Tax=Runella sp. TaxID=1960881 RepID=UPI003D1138E0